MEAHARDELVIRNERPGISGISDYIPGTCSGVFMADLESEIASRRTFAIIAHPDAGKTTLTEKLLLFGGAIQLAGAVKARGEQRRAHSD